jgi:hypothetical protein
VANWVQVAALSRKSSHLSPGLHCSRAFELLPNHLELCFHPESERINTLQRCTEDSHLSNDINVLSDTSSFVFNVLNSLLPRLSHCHNALTFITTSTCKSTRAFILDKTSSHKRQCFICDGFSTREYLAMSGDSFGMLGMGAERTGTL